MSDKQHDERCRQLNLTLLCDLDEGPCVGSDEAHLKHARELSMEVVNEVVADMPAEHPDQLRANDMAAGLRTVARMIEENPHLANNIVAELNVHLRSDDPAAEMAAIARTTRRYGARTDKSISEKMHNVRCDFGSVRLDILAWRDEVCERVVVGTREVVEEVPDPELLAAVPTTTVTRTEEIVEWQCKPLLAGGAVTE